MTQSNGPPNTSPQVTTSRVKSDIGPVDFSRDIAPLFEKYCVSCHGGDKPKADLRLAFKDTAETREKAVADRKFWEKVADSVRTGEMPPGKRPKPTDGEKNRLVRWIDDDLLALDCTGPRDPGRVTARRLNKYEFRNTIRDLLHLKDYQPAVDFPADDRAYGFDNNGDILTLSPNLVELYLKATEEALKTAYKMPAAKSVLNLPAQGFKSDMAYSQGKVRLIIDVFAPRAYRRSLTKEEVDRLMHFAALSFTHDGESVDKATSLTMRAALMSPEFLFRIERGEKPDADGAVRLTEYELASRLSYFLWSSMPDDELFKLAKENKLRSSLADQVRRMLKDPKAIALTESFAGQWLEIRGLETVTRDPELYPGFTPALRRAMKRETELFFETVVREDRDITDFLTANFSYLNETLAEHYGIPGVKGDEFRRVELDPERRGGILTQASFLTVTSKPTRTSPVNRGKWVLENLFNAPPPPPPPDTPTLEDDGKKLTGTLREIMAKHRQDSNCISCHERMDPLGFALENYDAVGSWRDKDGADPIDASGTLVSGQTFKNPKEFRAVMATKRNEFRRGLAEKMLIYALGRGLEYYDKCSVDDICAATAAGDDRFSALVLAITKSDPFQYRAGKKGKRE